MFTSAKVQVWCANSWHRTGKLLPKSLYYPMPIVPGVAHGRMVHHKSFHPLATRHHIKSIRHPSTFHFDVIAIHPVNTRCFLMLPVVSRQIVPKPLAPYDDVFGLTLFDDLKECLASLLILPRSTCLTRSAHCHLQIVEEYHRVPNLQSHRLVSFLTHQRTLELQESTHPILSFRPFIEIISKHMLRKVHALPMQTAIAAVHTSLVTIMAFAQYHDALAKKPSVDIILANERLKENITHNWLSFHYLANPMHNLVFQRL